MKNSIRYSCGVSVPTRAPVRRTCGKTYFPHSYRTVLFYQDPYPNEYAIIIEINIIIRIKSLILKKFAQVFNVDGIKNKYTILLLG